MPLITGRIRNRAGDPLEGVRVKITDAPTTIADVAFVTGSDGAFILSASAVGSYEITCVSDRDATKARIDVGEQDRVDVDVTL